MNHSSIERTSQNQHSRVFHNPSAKYSFPILKELTINELSWQLKVYALLDILYSTIIKPFKNMKLLILILSVFSFTSLTAQEKPEVLKNSSEKMIENESKLTIGGYAQMDFNQPVGDGVYHNGTLDVHRMVLLFGYKFNDRAQFISEIEAEHVNEFLVEQAFLNYKILPWLNFRGGLMLIPMGIVNEYHEPPLYNGVERPNVDNKIVPSTWRELGAGFAGTINSASLKYQVYLVNGFKSYDGTSYLTGSNGLRNGRQKGIASFMSTPNLSAKIDYFGLPGLKFGLSGYFGGTQSSLYNNLSKDNAAGIAKADSSVVGVTMIGADARYVKKGWELRAQYIKTFIQNSDQYNAFTKKDMGSEMEGWYVEAGYNVFQTIPSISSQLVPFVRYEQYDTQHKTEGTVLRNKANNKTEITAGIGWRITPSVALKGDYQWIKSEAANNYSGQYNLGIGLMF